MHYKHEIRVWAGASPIINIVDKKNLFEINFLKRKHYNTIKFAITRLFIFYIFFCFFNKFTLLLTQPFCYFFSHKLVLFKFIQKLFMFNHEDWYYSFILLKVVAVSIKVGVWKNEKCEISGAAQCEVFNKIWLQKEVHHWGCAKNVLDEWCTKENDCLKMNKMKG